jgi:hypothetical protein
MQRENFGMILRSKSYNLCRTTYKSWWHSARDDGRPFWYRRSADGEIDSTSMTLETLIAFPL